VKFVSPALKHIVFPVLSRSGYLHHTAGSGPAVVTYHGVFPSGYEIRNHALDGNLVHADSFRRQLSLLKRHYHVITPDDFLEWSQLEWSQRTSSLPPRSILLTCDDALQNTVTEMLPILQSLHLSCLFFATGASAGPHPSMLWYEQLYLMLLEAGAPISIALPEAAISLGPIAPNQIHAHWWKLVGQLSQFDQELRRQFLDQIREQLKLPESWPDNIVQNPTLAARFLVVDRAGLRQLASAGMTIGAHSLSHPVLSRAPDGMALQEIFQSRTVLEEVLEKNVWAFGYPFGNPETVSARELRLAEQAGFQCAFMNTGGGLGANSGIKIDRFAIPRVHVTADMNLSEFEAHIAGFYRNLRAKLLRGDQLSASVGA
jgi:peptidoglycan/xylan/chitin deacetylase (PgdA/CDA1 family)